MPRAANQATLSRHGSPRVAHKYRPPSEWSIGETRGAHGRQQGGAPPRVPLTLLLLVGVVIQRGHHGGLYRRGHHHPGVFAHRQQLGDQAWISGDEAGPVAGQRRGLRQRVHRQQPGVVAVADRRVQHRERLGVPAQPQVALVGSHARHRARAPTRRPCAGGRHRAPVRSGCSASSDRTSAGDCGPSWVSESARSTCAPASRAPTSYVG